jgi:enoyl-CoA hydratase/carnithine racemase
VAAGSTPLRYERSGAAAVITIDRPERRNAIDGPTAEALHGAFRAFAEDDGARVLIVTGAGEEAFCAGADLKALDTLQTDAAGGPLGFTRLSSPKPTIAAVSGWCLAGGFELALWCDLRVAAPSARFGFTERRFGVPLIDGGTQRLPRIVGSGRALDLVISGRVIDVEEAERFGLVTEVVAAGAHVERALAMAEAIAAFPQDTLLSDRRAVLEGAGLPLVQGLALEAQLGRGRHGLALEGAQRFAAGEGRGASGTGI